ncbi:unnamed protein product [Phytophthora fragariaefolia]|uniref:Unnamed protein product n=1 Tax=Phytophthora fragariaefolia TaxID=1490495 RepID=A0A9W6TTF7_9STRA|nr:unnamed protein product [Phytophthora fragariaefolia]
MQCYNDHKQKHALKYQGVMATDGLFIDIYGLLLGVAMTSTYFAKAVVFSDSTVSAPTSSVCMVILRTQIDRHCRSGAKDPVLHEIRKLLASQ